MLWRSKRAEPEEVDRLRRELDETREKLSKNKRRLQAVREQLAAKVQEAETLRQRLMGSEETFDPERILWIFCTGRSGSTWLASMMGDLPGNAMWDEPLVGALFGGFYYERVGYKRGAKFIMGPRHKNAWLGSIRHTVLEGAAARYPDLQGILVIKEPHGSMGAPLLIEALPESRIIFLVRDPRDILASALDGHREKSWISRVRNRRPRKPGEAGDQDTYRESDSDPEGFLREKAAACLRDIGKAKEAYEAHEGRKVLVRYEDLRADTLGTMKRICAALEIPEGEEELARVVQKHEWENIPVEQKGEGKFYRKAKPGGWKEDLTPEQAEMVERMTAPLLGEFYVG